MPQKARKNQLGTVSFVLAALAFVLVAFVFRRPLSAYSVLGFNLQSLLEAAFEAALVGACADWYAVVALFRHPLGLPIPHTRILPNKKGEIAAGVQDMVGTFLNPRSMAEVLVGKHLGEMAFHLIDRGRASGLFAELLTRLTPILTHELRSRHILGPFLAPLIRRLRSDIDYAQWTVGLLKFIKREGIDALLIDFASEQALSFASQETNFIADRLVKSVRGLSGEGLSGRIKLWLVKKLMSEKETVSLIERLLPKLRVELAPPTGSLRLSLQEILAAAMAELDSNPATAAMLNRHLRTLVQSIDLEAVLRALNRWTADYLERELDKGEKERFATLRGLLHEVLVEARSNVHLIDELDQMLKEIILVVIRSEVLVRELGSIAASEVMRMSDEHLVAFIEDKVGPDLQYIRVNGAVIGWLVGVGLYCLKSLAT